MSLFSLLRRRGAHSVELLRNEHAAECARLHGLYFSHPWSISEFESMIASEPIYGAAALEEGKPRLLGFVLTRRAADEAEILTIAVDKSVRKRGIGREMLDHQADQLRRAGVRKLFLEVEEGNAAARRLYERYGFAQVGQRQGYYRTLEGIPANALILACDLR